MGQRYVGQLGEIDRLFMLWGTVGFLAGAGIGFAYVCPIAALIKWFPERKGLVSGIAVAGFGFGAYIFSHPQLPFSAETYVRTHGIVSLFTAHGLVSIMLITLGASLLTNPPATLQVKFESTWQDTLRRPAFYTLWLMFFSGAMAGLMVIGILKGFAGEQLVNAAGEWRPWAMRAPVNSSTAASRWWAGWRCSTRSAGSCGAWFRIGWGARRRSSRCSSSRPR